MNSSTPTPSPHHNNTDSVEDDHLGNREEFLSGSVAKSSTAVATVVATAGELDSPEEGYYNVKHRADDGDEEDDYYNSVPGASSSQPLLDPEDNQYIYIQNSDVPRPAPPVAASAGKPTVAAKPRHLSSPVAQPKKKYINLGPNQRQILQEKVRGTSVKTTAEEPAPVPMPMANGGTTEAEADVDDSADQPLYENLRDEEEEDVGGREIYENIMR